VVEHEGRRHRLEAVVGQRQVGQAADDHVGAEGGRGQCGHLRVGLDTDGVVTRLAGRLHERTGAAPDVEQPPVAWQVGDQGPDRAGAQAGEAACVGVRHACPECFGHEARP
jgi:hypothetical protein